MAGPQKKKRKIGQGPTLTLKLLRQALDCAILLDDLEEGSVQLLLLLRQLHGHPRAIHVRPYDDDQRVRT
jgi:hypothetical protein